MTQQQDQKTTQTGVIDDNLRRVYHDTIEEGVPDRFKDLLAQLKQQDADQEQKG